MTQIFSGNVFNISSSSCIWAIIQYDKKRDGANMLYQFNYKLYLAKNDGTGTPVPSTWSTNYSNNLKTVFTLNGTNVWTQNSQSSNQRWSFEYTTDWFTISNKTSGTTPFKFTIKDTQNSSWCNYTSSTFSLGVDPAGSDIGAVANFNIGNAITVPITKYASMYDVIVVKIGSTTIKTFNNAQDPTTITFTSSELNKIYELTKNDKKKEFTFVLTTYEDSSKATVVGVAKTTTATGYIVGSDPSINSITFEDTNSTTKALTNDSSKMVRYKSNVKVSVSASGVNSATITSVTINDKTATLSNGYYVATFNSVSTNSFKVVVVDSRGFDTPDTKTMPMVSYIPLTLSANVYRDEPTNGKVVIDYSGNYFSGSFGSVSNTLTVQYRYIEKGGSWEDVWNTLTPTIVGNTYNGNAIIEGFDYQKQYVFQVRATDKLNSPEPTVVNVTKGEAILYWKENLAGVNGDFVVKSDKSIKSGKYFESNYREAFQTGLFGSNNNGFRFKAIRSAIPANGNYPQYASGMAWATGDTHGLLLADYRESSPQLVVGGGNQDKVNWIRHVAFTEDLTNVAHKSDLVAYITESGSNSNGRYIKYSDGTMVCWGNFSVTGNVTGEWGSLYGQEITNPATFPATFKEVNVVNINTSGDYSALIGRVNASTSKITFLQIARPWALSNTTLWFDYVARGTWK